MKTSLKDSIEKQYAQNEETAATTPEVASTALATAEPADALAVNDRFFNNEDLVGNFSSDDIILPRLNLVQGVGPLSEHYSPGQLVLNKSQIVGSGTQPLEFTVLRLKKFFEEKLPYGGEIMPRVFDTEEQARSAGLASMRNPVEGLGNYQPVVDCEILVASPSAEDTEGNFQLEFDGKLYARAVYTARSVAYSVAGKAFISAAVFNAKAGLHSLRWLLTPTREKVGKNMVWLPRVKVAGRHTSAFAEWAKSLKA